MKKEHSADNREPVPEELGGKLLEGVSRSFYLTLKALPHGVREPLSLAYLLARAADTMADTAQVPTAVRSECLRQFDRLEEYVFGRDVERAVAFGLVRNQRQQQHESRSHG